MSETPEQRRKPGRKPRGVRRQFPIRVPAEQFMLYQRQAEAQGIAIGDYIVAALARAHQLPEPEYVTESREQARKQQREVKEGHLPIAM